MRPCHEAWGTVKSRRQRQRFGNAVQQALGGHPVARLCCHALSGRSAGPEYGPPWVDVVLLWPADTGQENAVVIPSKQSFNG